MYYRPTGSIRSHFGNFGMHKYRIRKPISFLKIHSSLRVSDQSDRSVKLSWSSQDFQNFDTMLHQSRNTHCGVHEN
jgi:uncharacterized protein YigA (DUF484 family)